MKLRKIFLLVLFLSPSAVFANAKVIGNGGNAVICKNRAGKIVKAEMFDLYEGNVLKHLSYAESSDSPMSQAVALANKISEANGTSYSAENFASAVDGTFKMFRFLPSGAGLKPIDDGGEVIVPKKGCSKVQTANRLDSENILVDTDVWKAMSNTQKAALILHEAIYQHMQHANVQGRTVETDSGRTRRLVAHLFSGGSLDTTFSSKKYAIGKILLCRTNLEDLSSVTTTMFTAYQEDNRTVTIQFERWLSHRVLTRTTVRNYLSAGQSWPVDAAQDLVISGGLNSPAEDQIKTVAKFTSATSGEIWFDQYGLRTSSEKFECF